jgi:peptide methionine sulfoxide reductase MsrA
MSGLQVLYNPAEVSYKQLLEKFTSIHNPTQLNRQVCIFALAETHRKPGDGMWRRLTSPTCDMQGGDVGTQYRWPNLQH